MAETKTINLDVETNLGSLKSQLRQAQAAVAALSDQFGATSQQAAEAAKRAAELKDRIEDAKNLTDAFNPDAKFNALSSSIGGVLNGFQAYEGAMGLIGAESEALQATLLKVQSAMALSQGIQGAMEAKDSFIQLGAVVKNAFVGMTTASKVFMSVGILALVSGIIYLATEVKAVTRAFEDFTDWLGFTDNAAKRNAKAIEDNARRVAAANERVNTSNKARAAAAAAAYDHEIAMAEIAGKDTTKLEIEKSQNQSQAARERYNTALEEYNKLKGQNSKFAVERRKELKEQLDIERAFLRDERYARQQARAQNKADKIQAAEEEREEKLKEKRKQYEEATKELEEIRDKQLKPVELEKIKVRQEGLKALQGSINQEALMRQQAADLELLQLQVKAQRARKIEEQSQSFRVKAVQDGLSAIASITELFGRKSEKAAKRAFQVQKAANMASALISTYQSATAAYASQFTPVPTPDSPIRGGIAAGIAVATGLANVAKIAQQKFESPSSSGGGGNVSGGGGGNVSGGGGGVMSPNFNIVGNSGFNQLAQIQQQPIQAYVVSGEVTSAQALDRNRIKNATL
jgi:hypothetical protein